MTLESASQIATIVGVVILVLSALATSVIFVRPWVKSKLKDWWNRERDRNEVTLGSKTQSGQREKHPPEYTIGYLYISYKTSNRKRFIYWNYEFRDAFYKWIGKIRKLENTANTRSINNIIKHMKERSNTRDGSKASYIYQEEKPLAFYPIKKFDHIPEWANLPCIERQIRIYFKRYETKKHNQYDIRNGKKWLKLEELEQYEWLSIVRVNVEYNQDPLMPESKKIKRVLKKGFRKQFSVNKIGHFVSIKRRIAL